MFEPDAITAVVRRLRLLWGAFLLSVIVFYVVVAMFLRRGVLAITSQLNPSMLGTLAIVVAALGLLLAPVLRRRIEQAPRTAGPDEIARRWQTGWIVGQALKEFVGIAGLAIALLAGSSAWAVGFAIASVASMVLTPPWEHELRLRIHRAEEARGAFLGR